MRIAIFGAGIAGLTAAHELVRRGHDISVHEALAEPGGFFRSARRSQDECIPSEYSWHGFGPWYHNAYEIMKHIPLDGTGSVYGKGLSRPIDFGIFPDGGTAGFYDLGLPSVPGMFRMQGMDFPRWAWLMLKSWTAGRRSETLYAALNAAEAWGRRLHPRAARTWRASFGPWIGSDWTRVSLHQAGRFFQKQLITRPSHRHAADEEGPAWSHGAGDGWLLLRGPSSEYWFKPWRKELERYGVRFIWEDPLVSLAYDGSRIESACVASGGKVTADRYILAVNPFAMVEIISRSPGLARERELRLFKPLVQDGPHTQVSFRIAFSDPIAFPRRRTAAVLADSEFNLTLFPQEQVWRQGVKMGDNVGSLWTGTSCVGTVPGRLYKLPVIKCSKDQFIEEVKAQILGCASLDALVREANGGRSLAQFRIVSVEVWHEWQFRPDGIRPLQRKWVNTTRTQPYLPRQVTSIPNLLLAGAHTRTAADVWSIEAAVESGRRAAGVIAQDISVIPQYVPRVIRALRRVDDACFSIRLPHVLDLSLIIVIGCLCAILTICLVNF